jgi:hypothetical protein
VLAGAAFVLSTGAAADGAGLFGAVCADFAGVLDFDGCCAPADPTKPETTTAVIRIVSFAEFFITKSSV